MPAMPPIDATWIAVGAVAGLVLLVLILRLPFIGTFLRWVFSLVLIGVLALVLLERASVDPYFAGLASRFNLGGQQVDGKEDRVKMAPNGQYCVSASIAGTNRRMMVDSGATITALSTATAAAAGLHPKPELMPVVLQTANGMVQADTAEVGELRIGTVVARDRRVVVSPAFGRLDVLGMNFLSRLQSWRVEGDTLVLVPHHPQKVG